MEKLLWVNLFVIFRWNCWNRALYSNQCSLCSQS